MGVHETAIIGSNVELGEGVVVGPFSVIKGQTKIGAGTIIESHVSIGSDYGLVTIGTGNHIYQSAVVGGPPQDLKYKDEQTELIVGNNNAIREFVTLNIGTKTGGGKTIIGDGNLLMAYVHVAHDCIVKNNVIIANSTQLAGHVEIDDRVTIGGCCAISQFCRLGKFSYIGGDSTINKDILPFCLAEGRWAVMRATNKIGLERGGFSKSEIESIHKAIRFVTKGNRTVDEAVEKIKAECAPNDHIAHMLNFIATSKKGLAR